jgi:DNA-directed RNA polymerase specialized sigma24 family protein
VGTSRTAPTSDVEVFEALYPGLCRFAAAVRPVGIEPEDLVQEALARTLAVRSLTSMEEPQAYLRTAMIRIAANLARGDRRARARRARQSTPASSALDSYPSDLNDLLRVEPRARAVLFLTIIEGEPYSTAATIVGCSEVAARALASRALHALQRALVDELDPEESR